ncbi:MAG: outer membrane protein assembly factor BamB [Kangiellaceae bacterium]|jgi:outer membrane protein assembly factor BamB
MRLPIIAIVAAALLLSGCSDDEDLYLPNPLVDIENQFETQVLWSTDIGDGLGERSGKISPVYAYKKIYIADSEGKVAAVNPDNGKIIWETNSELPIAGGPAVANRIVAVGTSQGEVLVLDAETGEEIWRAQVSSEVISSPAIGEGHVAVRTVDGKVYAFDAKTGEQKWFYDESLPALTLRGNSAPVIASGGVISGFANGKLSVFLLSNGQPAWEKRIATPLGSSEIQRLVDVDLKPLVIGPTIYIGSFNGNLAALDLRNGEFQWQRELSTFQDMAVGELLLFVTHENSYLSAVNRANGVIIWTQKDLHRRQLTTPGVLGEYAIAGDFEGYVHWMSIRTGEIVSREHIDSSGISAVPLIIGDKAIMYTRDGELVAIKRKSK